MSEVKMPRRWGRSYGNSSFGFSLSVSMPMPSITPGKLAEAWRIAEETAAGMGVYRLSKKVKITFEFDAIFIEFFRSDDGE